MLDRMDAGTNGIFHSRGTMRMGRDLSPGACRFVDGGAEFFERHLRLFRRSPRRQHPPGGDHLDDFRSGLDLFLHDFSDLLWACDFLSDEAGMTSNHTDGQAGADDAWPRGEPLVDCLLEREDRVVPRADIPNGGHTCLKGVLRRPCGFEQRLGRCFFLDGFDDVGFSPEAEMDVAIDQSWEHRQAAPVDACRASWNGNRAARAGGRNLIVLDDDGCRFDGLSGSVDQPDVVYGDGHVVSFLSET